MNNIKINMDSSQGARVENGEFSTRHGFHVSLPPWKLLVGPPDLGLFI